MNPAQAVASYVASLRIGQGRHAGERFRLLGWQRKFLRGAFGQDGDGPLVAPMAETLVVGSSFE